MQFTNVETFVLRLGKEQALKPVEFFRKLRKICPFFQNYILYNQEYELKIKFLFTICPDLGWDTVNFPASSCSVLD